MKISDLLIPGCSLIQIKLIVLLFTMDLLFCFSSPYRTNSNAAVASYEDDESSSVGQDLSGHMSEDDSNDGIISVSSRIGESGLGRSGCW